MEQYIRDYAIGYYNDDRVKVIRELEKGEIFSDYHASKFILDYDKVIPESVRRWRRRLVDTHIDKEEMRQLADELLKADPVGWTDEQALYILARRFMDMVKSARGYTERNILSDMLCKTFPDVVTKMEELSLKDADDDRWFNGFLDRALLEDEAETKEAGQAPSD